MRRQKREEPEERGRTIVTNRERGTEDERAKKGRGLRREGMRESSFLILRPLTRPSFRSVTRSGPSAHRSRGFTIRQSCLRRRLANTMAEHKCLVSLY